jgi:hypothetical protein
VPEPLGTDALDPRGATGSLPDGTEDVSANESAVLPVEDEARSPSFETWDRICKLYGWPQTFVDVSRALDPFKVPAERSRKYWPPSSSGKDEVNHPG